MSEEGAKRSGQSPNDLSEFSLQWRFRRDYDRNAYASRRNDGLFRRSPVLSIAVVVLVPVLLVALWPVHWVLSIFAALTIIFLFQFNNLRSGYWTGRYGFDQVELQFERGKITLIEWYDGNYIEQGTQFLETKSRGTWRIDGCILGFSAMPLTSNRLLLPIEFFRDAESVEKFHKWASQNGIHIEGKPPVIGATNFYVRKKSQRASNELVWNFDSDADVVNYTRLRNRNLFRGSWILKHLFNFGSFVLLLFYFFPNWYVPVSIAILQYIFVELREVWKRGVQLNAGLDRVKVLLLKGAMDFGEVTAGGFQPINRLEVSSIRTATWHGGGCIFERVRWQILLPPVEIPQQFFSEPGAVRSLLEWAEENNVNIEGIPPLGVYPRPLEGEL